MPWTVSLHLNRNGHVGQKTHASIDDLIKASKSWDGYEREDAVQQLGCLTNPDRRAIAALRKRANDWVPQVRVAAVKAILRLLVDDNVLPFIETLPDVYHLRNCYRDIHDCLISKIKAFLLKNENKPYVIEGIQSSIKGVGRECLRLSMMTQIRARELGLLD